MNNSYEKENYTLIDWLCNSNNAKTAEIRGMLRTLEQSVISRQVVLDRTLNRVYDSDKTLKLLSAGSGLGNELIEMAEIKDRFNNKDIKGIDEFVGIESDSLLCKIANNYINPQNYSNNNLNYLKTDKIITIVNGDFFNMPFENGEFNYSLLNTGTIGNFSDDKKIALLKEMMRVTSRMTFVTFFDPSEDATKKRIEMYEQEGVEGDCEITRKKYSTGGASTRITYEKMGLFSEAMSLDRFDYLVRQAGNERVFYNQIENFAWMAKMFQ
jgi:hypothetical protein